MCVLVPLANSCTKRVEFNGLRLEHVTPLSVVAYIKTGDSINVALYRANGSNVIEYDEDGKVLEEPYSYISDMDVFVKLNSSEPQKLTYTSKKIGNQSRPTKKCYFYFFSGQQIANPGDTVKLMVYDKSGHCDSLVAVSIVPKAPNFSVTSFLVEPDKSTKGIDSTYIFNCLLVDDPATDDFYYLDSAHFSPSSIFSDGNNNMNAYVSDKLLEASNQMFIITKKSDSESPKSPNDTLLQIMVKTHTMTFYSITKDHYLYYTQVTNYDYNYKYNIFQRDPLAPYSNINGGYGIFTFLTPTTISLDIPYYVWSEGVN